MRFSGISYRALVRNERRGIWPAIQRGGLRLASVPYGLGTRLRNRLYDLGWKRACRASVPVISIGNLTLGGTGKTPCVEYVARFYRGLDLRIAILSRGYGSVGGCNDEALLLEENLPDVPHLLGADRFALAKVATEELESQILLLDDGFQHRRLARDLDIVLVDATDPWGQGFLFPRGLLREPPGELKRAGLVLLTRCDQVDGDVRKRILARVKRLAPDVPLVESRHQPDVLVNSDRGILSVEVLKQRPIAAFCGLGNPEAFRRTLTDLGAALSAFRAYPDHHAYTRPDVEELRAWARRQATDCVIVTTQKDLVKLRLTQLSGRELWALRIRLHLTAGQPELDRRLKEAIG